MHSAGVTAKAGAIQANKYKQGAKLGVTQVEGHGAGTPPKVTSRVIPRFGSTAPATMTATLRGYGWRKEQGRPAEVRGADRLMK